jgi:hypothetical protein
MQSAVRSVRAVADADRSLREGMLVQMMREDRV